MSFEQHCNDREEEHYHHRNDGIGHYNDDDHDVHQNVNDGDDDDCCDGSLPLFRLFAIPLIARRSPQTIVLQKFKEIFVEEKMIIFCRRKTEHTSII